MLPNLKSTENNKKSTMKLLDMKAVSEMVCLSRNTIYSMIRRGLFPAQIKVTPYASRWLESEINTWIQNRADKRGDCDE